LPGTKVKNVHKKKVGVVVPDVHGLSDSHEEMVVWDGSDVGVHAEVDQLRAIGRYDPNVADKEKCGIHMGSLGCKYLSVGESGDRCLRFDDQRRQILSDAARGDTLSGYK